MAEAFDVVVPGSLHLDIMVKGPRLPRLDETVMGEAWAYKCGGKGGNQAVAAAKAGARTAFAGRVGDDDFGQRLLANLDSAGIDRTRIVIDAAAGSGMSVAIETAEGDYGAVVVSGANQRIAADQLVGLTARVVLLQNEIAPAINLAAARQAKANGALVVHNMAPFIPVDEELLRLTDLVIVNRVEAEGFCGLTDPRAAAEAIAKRAPAVIVTAGKDGASVAQAGALTHIAARPVTVKSSHGAGDCYCGTLAAHLARGAKLIDAARVASDVAAQFVAGENTNRRKC
jgi:ribokinase